MSNISRINHDLCGAREDASSRSRAVGNCGPRDALALLRIAEVLRITGLSKSALYRLAAAGVLVPVKLTERSSAWVAEEVHSYVQARIAARDAQESAA